VRQHGSCRGLCRRRQRPHIGEPADPTPGTDPEIPRGCPLPARGHTLRHLPDLATGEGVARTLARPGRGASSVQPPAGRRRGAHSLYMHRGPAYRGESSVVPDTGGTCPGPRYARSEVHQRPQALRVKAVEASPGWRPWSRPSGGMSLSEKSPRSVCDALRAGPRAGRRAQPEAMWPHPVTPVHQGAATPSAGRRHGVRRPPTARLER
jgi:hypothetical protein